LHYYHNWKFSKTGHNFGYIVAGFFMVSSLAADALVLLQVGITVRARMFHILTIVYAERYEATEISNWFSDTVTK
jgi:hypothetical protein